MADQEPGRSSPDENEATFDEAPTQISPEEEQEGEVPSVMDTVEGGAEEEPLYQDDIEGDMGSGLFAAPDLGDDDSVTRHADETEPETMDPMFAAVEEEELRRERGLEGEEEPSAEMEVQEQVPAPLVMRKKVTPAKSAWMFFMLEVREEVKKEQPGLKITQIAKIVGERWKALGEEQRKVYTEMAKKDKERFQQETLEQGGGNEPESMEVEGRSITMDTVLPLASVRRIVKLDPEVKNVAKDAALLIAKAAELFVDVLCEESVRVAQASKRKTMKGDDVAAGMRRKERLSFLRPDFPMDTSTRRVAVAPRKPAAASVAPAAGQKGIAAFYSKKRANQDEAPDTEEPN